MKKLIVISMLMCLGLASHAQDVIALRSGDEIKGKVTEISTTEIRYKRADNPDGPTVVIARNDVFAIKYANGTREVINATTAATAAPAAPAATAAPAASAYTAAPATAVAASAQRVPAGGAPHEKDFYTGVYFNPLGFLLAGPMLGAELTFKRHFIIDGHLRFIPAGALSGFLAEGDFNVSNLSGIGVGVSGKYFTGGNRGGFYVGPAIEFYSQSYDYASEGTWEGSGVIGAANLGYKFQYNSGFYMRAGGYLGFRATTGEYRLNYSGTRRDTEGSGAFFSAEFALGWAF